MEKQLTNEIRGTLISLTYFLSYIENDSRPLTIDECIKYKDKARVQYLNDPIFAGLIDRATMEIMEHVKEHDKRGMNRLWNSIKAIAKEENEKLLQI